MRRLGILLVTLVLGLDAVAQADSAGILQVKSEAAKAAMDARDFSKAAELYRELADLLPDLPGPRMNLGIALYMDGQYAAAAAELEPVAGKTQEFAPALLFLGASRLKLADPTGAEPPLRAYLEAEPQNAAGRTMLAEALLLLEDYSGAAEQFRALTAIEPESPRVWHGLGRCYEALARAAFERLDASAPESAQWLALLADSRMAQQQFQSAFFLYRKALEKEPIRGLHVAVAQIYRMTGHPDWADQEEQKELDLGLPDCGSEPLVCDFLAGRLLEVTQSAGRQDTAEALYWAGKAYDRLALSAYSRLAQLPPSYELHALTAEIHRGNGRHQEAAAQWEKALSLSPEDPAARQELAISLFLARDYDSAAPLVEELLAKEPDSAQFNFLAGAIRLNREQAQAALPFLRKALQRDPHLKAAQNSLGRAYLALGQPEKAIPYLEAVLDGDDDGSIHYQLSRAYQSAGRADDARALLEKYQQIQESRELDRVRLEEEVQITPPQ